MLKPWVKWTVRIVTFPLYVIFKMSDWIFDIFEKAWEE